MNMQDDITMSMAEEVKKVIEDKKDYMPSLPHMMYDPKTGKGHEAKTREDHLKMKDMGYTHEKPSAKDEKALDDNGKNTEDLKALHAIKKSSPQFEEVESTEITEDDKEVEEGNEFTAAAAKAKLAGEDEFEFDGKTYPTEISQDAAEKILGKKESADLEEVEITEATAYSEIEKVFKWAKKYMRASKGKNYPDVTVNTKFKDSIYVFLNLSIYNIMAISLGGEKGILVKHDTRKMEKGSDFKRKEHEFSSAKDVIKFAKKEYDSMPKDESVEESANLEEAIMLQHYGFVVSANLEEAYDADEKHTMDPKSHVELNKETGMYCVYNIKGKKVAEFKTKEEAEEYAVKNHDALMKESADLEEAIKPEDFVKGGDAKATQKDVDGMLSKLFMNNKLAKQVEASTSYKAGEKDAGKKKNPYKKDTSDFHLYELGAQSAQAS